MASAQQHAQQTRNAWDAVAAGYDEFVTPTHETLANEAPRRAGLRPGMRFLDVAAGSGALGLAAARLGAEAVATDISPRMIDLLNAHAREEHLSNLKGLVMDGHDLQLDDDSFDCSGSMFGVMLFPNLLQGLSEMVRVTRPGGRVVVVTFGPPQQVEFLAFFLKAARQVVPDFTGLPMDPPPLPFQVADPARLHQAFVNAGASAITVDTTTEHQEFASAAELWNWVGSSNPIGASMIAGLSSEQRLSVQRVLEDMLRERAGGPGPAQLTNAINIGIGTA